MAPVFLQPVCLRPLLLPSIPNITILRFLKNTNSLYFYIFIFLLSRAAFYVAGIRFDVSYLDIDWHSIDRNLVQHHLFESLLYQHSHAPLFNAAAGVMVKLFPDHYPAILNVIYIALGIFQIFLLYKTALLLHLSKTSIILIVLFYSINPSIIFYENWFFYDYPVSVMITGCCYLYIKYISTEKKSILFYFFILLSILLLTRSFFNIVLFIFFIASFIIQKKASWPVVLQMAALPLCLVLGVMGKNMYVFGHFSTSTWLGMNVSRIALRNVPIESAIEAHQLSPVCRFPPFSPVEQYQPLLKQPDQRYTSIKILSDTHKSNDSINYNHIDYIQVSDTFKAASAWAIQTYPINYLKNVLYATSIYFTPAFSYNTKFIKNKYINLYSNVTSLNLHQLSKPETTSVRRYFGAMIYNFITSVFLLIVIIYNLYLNKFTQKHISFIFVFSTFYFYVFFIGNMLEFGENMRFKFQILPVSIILFFIVIEKIIQLKRCCCSA